MQEEIVFCTTPRVHLTLAALEAIETHRCRFAPGFPSKKIHMKTVQSVFATVAAHSNDAFYSRYRVNMFSPFEYENIEEKDQLWLVYTDRRNGVVHVGTEKTMPLGDIYHVRRAIYEASVGI